MDSKILLVDDNPGMIQHMARILSGLAQIHYASNGEAALAQVREHAPDLVLLDAQMPGMSGFQVCEAMKADPQLRDIPVMFVTSHSDADFEQAGFKIGAVDFVSKPVSPPLLVARVATHLRLKRLNDDIRHLSTVDMLTRALNERGLDEALHRGWRQALRKDEPLSLLSIDVDHLKHYNERYGYPAGDACLHAMADVLKKCARRPLDFVARCHGDIFALLLTDTPRAGAQHVAMRFLHAVEALALPHATSPTAGHVTVSIGVSSYDHLCRTWCAPHAAALVAGTLMASEQDLRHGSNLALQAAKSRGRAMALFLAADEVQYPDRMAEVLMPPANGAPSAS
jgi:diguanylate cyclase (GGDEF)-like protein